MDDASSRKIAMQCMNNKPVGREAYIAKQHDEYDRTVFVSNTGLHIDCLV